MFVAGLTECHIILFGGEIVRELSEALGANYTAALTQYSKTTN